MVHVVLIVAVAAGVVAFGSAIVQGIRAAAREARQMARQQAFCQDLLNAARTGQISPPDMRKLAASHQIDGAELSDVLTALRKDMLTNRVEKDRHALSSIDHLLAERDTDALLRELPESLLGHAHKVAEKLGPDRIAFNELIHGFNDLHGRLVRERDHCAALTATLSFNRNLWRFGFVLLVLTLGLVVALRPELQQIILTWAHFFADWFR